MKGLVIGPQSGSGNSETQAQDERLCLKSTKIATCTRKERFARSIGMLAVSWLFNNLYNSEFQRPPGARCILQLPIPKTDRFLVS